MEPIFEMAHIHNTASLLAYHLSTADTEFRMFEDLDVEADDMHGEITNSGNPLHGEGSGGRIETLDDFNNLFTGGQFRPQQITATFHKKKENEIAHYCNICGSFGIDSSY